MIIYCALVIAVYSNLLFSEIKHHFHRDRTEKGEFLQCRTTKDAFIIARKPEPSRDGLEVLNASASSQLTESELKQLKKRVRSKSPFIVVDLREELHGLVNGQPVCCKSTKKLSDSINKTEKNLFSRRRIGTKVILLKGKKEKEIIIKSIATEAEVAHKYHLGYFRIPIIDHTIPTPAQIDTFLEFIDTLHPATHLHFHCRKGKGRATTFMVLYDIIKNSHKAPCNDIIARQHLIGGANVEHQDSYQDHRKLFKEFYVFAQARHKGLAMAWSTWTQRHKS
jgi:hypothetical protein